MVRFSPAHKRIRSESGGFFNLSAAQAFHGLRRHGPNQVRLPAAARDQITIRLAGSLVLQLQLFGLLPTSCQQECLNEWRIN